MIKHINIVLILLSFISLEAATKSPKDLLSSYMRTKLLQAPDTLTGEGVAWHAAWNIGVFQKSFLETKDPDYLEAAAKYFDALVGKMHKSPDGYRGFVGPYIYDKKFICDVHVADSILINPMLGLAELVLKSEYKDKLTHLKPQAEAYVALAKKDLIEKWEKRGTWYEDGDHGGYTSWNRYMTADDLSAWRDLKGTKSGLSLPFNKQFDMGIAHLRLHRITGDKFYHDRAAKIFNFLKRRLTLHDDHYIWSYWEPMTPNDIESDSKYTHWVNVHPYRNYQAGEMHNIVEAYHSGLTFDKTDMQRFINTNLKVMWNGDKASPKWVNSNHAMKKIATGKEPVYKTGHGFKTLAGTLWKDLADFDETIRDIGKLKKDKPVSFERHYPDIKEKIYNREMHDCPYVYMAAVIPSHIKAGADTKVCTAYFKSGNLSIDVYDAKGNKVQTISEIPAEEVVGAKQVITNKTWSTKGLKKGQYTVRWSIRGSYRQYPITIN